MMPSDSASAKPLIAALMVSDEVQLIAGNAKPPYLAVSSIRSVSYTHLTLPTNKEV